MSLSSSSQQILFKNKLSRLNPQWPITKATFNFIMFTIWSDVDKSKLLDALFSSPLLNIALEEIIYFQRTLHMLYGLFLMIFTCQFDGFNSVLGAILQDFRSSFFFSIKYTSLGANLPSKSFSETAPRINFTLFQLYFMLFVAHPALSHLILCSYTKCRTQLQKHGFCVHTAHVEQGVEVLVVEEDLGKENIQGRWDDSTTIFYHPSTWINK